MIGTNEDYDSVPAINGTESSSSEGGCISCRKKVAQETFNTVALNSGGYVPSIQNRFVNTPNVLEVLNGKSSYSNQLLNPNDFSEKPNSGIGTGMDDRIDPFKHPLKPNPCIEQPENYTRLNDDFDFMRKVLGSSKLTNFLEIFYYNNDDELKPVEFEITELLNNFLKDLWCINYYDEYSQKDQYLKRELLKDLFDKLFDKLFDDIKQKIQIESRDWFAKNPEKNRQIFNQYYTNLKKKLEHDYNLCSETDIFDNLLGAGAGSCWCILRDNPDADIRKAKPTYCCDLYENKFIDPLSILNPQKREECWCESTGLPKNLCKDCPEGEFNAEIHFPDFIISQSSGWWYSHFLGDSFISWTLYEKNKKISNGEFFGKFLNGDSYFNLPIPKSGIYILRLHIFGPCSECRNQSTGKMMEGRAKFFKDIDIKVDDENIVKIVDGDDWAYAGCESCSIFIPEIDP